MDEIADIKRRAGLLTEGYYDYVAKMNAPELAAYLTNKLRKDIEAAQKRGVDIAELVRLIREYLGAM